MSASTGTVRTAYVHALTCAGYHAGVKPRWCAAQVRPQGWKKCCAVTSTPRKLLSSNAPSSCASCTCGPCRDRRLLAYLAALPRYALSDSNDGRARTPAEVEEQRRKLQQAIVQVRKEMDRLAESRLCAVRACVCVCGRDDDGATCGPSPCPHSLL